MTPELVFRNCEQHAEFQKTCVHCYETSLSAGFGREGNLRQEIERLTQSLREKEEQLAKSTSEAHFVATHRENALLKHQIKELQDKVDWLNGCNSSSVEVAKNLGLENHGLREQISALRHALTSVKDYYNGKFGELYI